MHRMVFLAEKPVSGRTVSPRNLSVGRCPQHLAIWVFTFLATLAVNQLIVESVVARDEIVLYALPRNAESTPIVPNFTAAGINSPIRDGSSPPLASRQVNRRTTHYGEENRSQPLPTAPGANVPAAPLPPEIARQSPAQIPLDSGCQGSVRTPTNPQHRGNEGRPLRGGMRENAGGPVVGTSVGRFNAGGGRRMACEQVTRPNEEATWGPGMTFPSQWGNNGIITCAAIGNASSQRGASSPSSVVGVAFAGDWEEAKDRASGNAPTEEDPGYAQEPQAPSSWDPLAPIEDALILEPEEFNSGPTLLRKPQPLSALSGISPEVAPSERSAGKDGHSPSGIASQDAVAAPPAKARASSEGGPQPWKLIDGPRLQASRISVGGWLEQGITFNAQEPASRYNGPVATNDRHADYQLNQLWVYAFRPTQTDACGFDIGGRVDVVFGNDWRYGISRGLEDRINGVSQNYGLVLPQMYLEVAINRLTVKLGHFAGILDYEAVPAILNPFYSHSYSYSYTVPILVTGILASYQLTDQLTVDGGFHRGWMMFEDNNDDLDFMGGIRWKSPSERTQVTYAVSVGPQDDAGRQDRFVYSLVLRQKIGQRMEYVLVHNLGWEKEAVVWAQPRPQDAEWYGINQYFIYTLSPKLAAAARVEWLRDDDGVRIAGVGNLVPGKGWPALPGFAGDFYELTLGLNWRPAPNWLVRPEVRWDWYDGSRNLQGQLPFDDGSSRHQFTFATDVVLTF